MSAQGEIVNKVVNSGLVNFDISDLRPNGRRIGLDLKDFLEENGAKSIEFIGVDGNGCVKASVLAATKENYQVSVDLFAVGVANQKKFTKTLKQWQDCGIKIG